MRDIAEILVVINSRLSTTTGLHSRSSGGGHSSARCYMIRGPFDNQELLQPRHKVGPQEAWAVRVLSTEAHHCGQ